MRIRLAERFGDTIVSGEAGEELCQEIAAALSRKDRVTLDFAGVAVILSAFLNPAIGGLYKSLSADLVDRAVTMENGSKLQQSSFDAAKESGRQYYNDARARTRREAAITDLIAG